MEYIDLLGKYSFRLLLSFLLGFILGLERKSRQHTVGIKTLVLISVSSALLGILSVAMAENSTVFGDPTRIAAGVITGIGFIGGGAILKQGLNIRGLTTAALIFLTSAIGLSCGAGLYIPVIITFLIAILSLIFLDKLEKKLFPATKNKILCLKFEGDEDINQGNIQKILNDNGMIIRDLNIVYTQKKGQTELNYSVKSPDNLDSLKLASQLGQVKTLVSFTLTTKQ